MSDGAIRILKIMQRQGKNTPEGVLEVGYIDNEKMLRAKGLKISAGDYMKNSDLTLEGGEQVLCTFIQDECIVICKIE